MRTRTFRVLAGLVAVAACCALPSPAAADTTEFKIQYVCNDRGVRYPIVGAPVEFFRVDPEWENEAGYEVVDIDRLLTTYTDGEGRASVTVSGDEYSFYFRLLLQTGEVETYTRYPDDWFADTGTNQNDVAVQDYGTQVIGDGRYSPECAVFEGLRWAYWDFLDMMGGPPPIGEGGLRPRQQPGIMRLNAHTVTWSGVPISDAGEIGWPRWYPTGADPGTFTSVYREFGESLYYGYVDDSINLLVADADRPCERARDVRPSFPAATHAFVKGWGEYWAGAWAPAPNCPGIARDDYLVPGNVASALAWTERFCPGIDRPAMVRVLANNPKRIYSYADFRNAIGCGPRSIADRWESGLRTDVIGPYASLGRRFARRQLRELRSEGRSLLSQLRSSRADARRAPCPPEPCTQSLVSVVAPFLLKAKVEQTELLEETLAPTASRRGLRRLGAPSAPRLERTLDRRMRAFNRDATEIGQQQVRRALRAAAPILRQDDSFTTNGVESDLHGYLRDFRRGRFPLAFTIRPPGATPLQPGEPLQPTETPPLQPPPGTAPPPPPPPGEPPPGAKPDLVVDSVAGACYLIIGHDTPTCYIEAVVRNAGGAAAPASMTALAPNDTYQNETLVDTPALDAGASTIVATECTTVTFKFSARADATGVVDESDETNNNRTNIASAEADCTY